MTDNKKPSICKRCLLMKNSIKLLIFDLDGTLIDSVPDIAVATNKMLADLGKQTFSEDDIRHWVGNGSRKLIERALAHAIEDKETITTSLINQAEQLFFQHYQQDCANKTVAYNGVDKGLIALKNHGFTLALVTNKPMQFVPSILAYFNWQDLFSVVLGGDSVAEKKPSPLPLNYVCEKLNISLKNAMMIGDSKNDIFAGKNAGMQTIGLSYGYNYGQAIEDFQPSYCFDNFSDMVEFLVEN